MARDTIQKHSNKLVLHVLVKREVDGHKWIAQGVEHDIVAQAENLKLLRARFMAAVLAYSHTAPKGASNALAHVPAAPKEYWKILENLQTKERDSKISPFPLRSRLTGEAAFLQLQAA